VSTRIVGELLPPVVPVVDIGRDPLSREAATEDDHGGLPDLGWSLRAAPAASKVRPRYLRHL